VLLTGFVLAPIRFYRRFISPAFPRRCRYEPTCSAYAEQSIRELGVARGSILAAWRLLRCNPFSDGGIDPVSSRRFFRHPDVPAAQDRAGVPAHRHQGRALPGSGGPGAPRSGVQEARR
jgi:hypothetical protein